MTDNCEAIKTLKNYSINIDLENIKSIIRQRGNVKIMNLLNLQYDTEETIPILENIPKSEEFAYFNVMNKIKKTINDTRMEPHTNRTGDEWRGLAFQ